MGNVYKLGKWTGKSERSYSCIRPHSWYPNAVVQSSFSEVWWKIFSLKYLWLFRWPVHSIEHYSLFWNAIWILLDETNFLETFFPVFYEMFNNLLVLYGKLLLSILYPRYFRAVKKWENKFNKWLFAILNLYGAWQILSAYFFVLFNFLRCCVAMFLMLA